MQKKSRAVVVLIFILGLLLVGVVANSVLSKTGKQDGGSGSGPKQRNVAAQATDVISVDELYSVRIDDSYSQMTISGQLSNSSDKELSVIVNLNVLDSQTGSSLGSFTETIDNVLPQQATPFSVTHKPYANSKNVTVKITVVAAYK